MRDAVMDSAREVKNWRARAATRDAESAVAPIHLGAGLGSSDYVHYQEDAGAVGWRGCVSNWLVVCRYLVVAEAAGLLLQRGWWRQREGGVEAERPCIGTRRFG